MQNKNGFTLLEILLVIAAIAILAGIVILALNPSKQLAEARNAQRQSDVNTLINAIYQYSIDNDGDVTGLNIPTGSDCAGTATNEICKEGGTCTSLVDVSALITDQTYLAGIPTDPQGESTNGAGYHVAQSTNGRITVCAPDAEQSATIEITR